MGLALGNRHHPFLDSGIMVQVRPVYVVHPVPNALKNFPAFGKGLQQGLFLMGPSLQLVFVISVGFEFFNGNQFSVG
jgi:hypothetical protein